MREAEAGAVGEGRRERRVRHVQHGRHDERHEHFPRREHVAAVQLDLRRRERLLGLALADDLGEEDDGHVENRAGQRAARPADEEAEAVAQEREAAQDGAVRALDLVVADADLL